MSNEKLNAIVELYQNSKLPSVVLGKDLRILWTNEAALARYPVLGLPGGLGLLLPKSIIDELMSGQEPFGLAGFSVSVTPLDEGWLLHFHGSGFSAGESALHPQGNLLLVSSISGQLRDPLSRTFSILSAMSQMAEIRDNEQLLELAEQANTSCYGLLRFTYCMTAYLRNLLGVEEYNFSRVDLRELLDRLGRAAGMLTASAGIPLQLRLTDHPVLLDADMEKLTSALLHLISNCCSHTAEDNEIELSLTDGGDAAVITISDRGAGIPPELTGRVFEPFFSYDFERRPYAGGGLGLTLANYIIRHHKGTLALASEPEKGTTVVIRLPITESDLTLKSAPLAVDILRDRFSTLHVLLSNSCGAPKP